MKLVHRDLVRRGPGCVKIVPEEDDDMWHAYNLICIGDSVQAVTVRKVVRDLASGGRDTERVKLKLEIKVENVDYDKEGSVLRIRGKNILESEHVKIGQFHTLEIEPHRPLLIRKEIWDSVALDILHQACDPGASADLAVLLMQEGLAHLFLVGRSITTTRARIETSIPRKHGPAVAGYESALKKFFENVLQTFLKHIDFKVVQCVVLGSPGFTKDQFRDYLLLESERRDLRAIIENKSRIILAHCNSGYKHSLKEVLDAPSVMTLIKDTKAAQEVRALKDFYAMLSNDSARACYGPKHVEIAHERMAIQTLLITDSLFRYSEDFCYESSRCGGDGEEESRCGCNGRRGGRKMRRRQSQREGAAAAVTEVEEGRCDEEEEEEDVMVAEKEDAAERLRKEDTAQRRRKKEDAAPVAEEKEGRCGAEEEEESGRRKQRRKRKKEKVSGMEKVRRSHLGFGDGKSRPSWHDIRGLPLDDNCNRFKKHNHDDFSKLIEHALMAIDAINSDIATRQKYVKFVESVKESGGNAHIFSSMHVSGEQLAQLTGVAAILRFPLPDLEDIEM